MTHPGDVDEYVAGVRQCLQASYDVELKDFEGATVVVGHRSDFRWRWGAARLHTTVTVAAFGADVGLPALESYLDASSRATRTGRIPRGLQTGTAAVAVAVLPSVSGTARGWADRAHGHRFAAVAYPVVVGLSPAEVVEPRRMRIGWVFRGFLREIVVDVVRTPLAR